MENPIKEDDDGGYPYFRKPPSNWPASSSGTRNHPAYPVLSERVSAAAKLADVGHLELLSPSTMGLATLDPLFVSTNQDEQISTT